MTTATRIVLASRPKGDATPDDFRTETAQIPAPEDGELALRTIWLSLDPYMRGRMNDGPSYAAATEIGEVMTGEVVAEVTESRDPRFVAGDIVLARIGWTTHGIVRGAEARKLDPDLAPVSTALGVLGMPGQTAWVGLNEILKMQRGETLVVGAATGAVGGVAGQLAKRAGLKTVGIAGGSEKCAYAVENLGYDVCLDHRDPDLAQELEALTPQGVDCYFENVGGKVLEAVLPRMNQDGRIAICGMVAWYSPEGLQNPPTLPPVWRTILTKRLRVQGFLVFDHADKLQPFLDEVGPLVGGGDLHYRESVAEGLEAAPQAFLDMLKGGNFGKQLVRVGADA